VAGRTRGRWRGGFVVGEGGRADGKERMGEPETVAASKKAVAGSSASEEALAGIEEGVKEEDGFEEGVEEGVMEEEGVEEGASGKGGTTARETEGVGGP
jgi:hypothetical protein